MENYKSQHGQDKWLNENFFKNKKGGSFIEIGAYDGIAFSNTYYYEVELGWTGICVEPLTYLWDSLRKSRSCFCFNCAISDTTGILPFKQIRGYTSMLSGLVGEYDVRHLNRVDTELKTIEGNSTETIMVEARSLSDVISETPMKHFDLCSIDVEGGELGVLKSIDFTKYTIDFFVIENFFEDKEIREFLRKKGYSLVANLGCDDVFKRGEV